MNLLATVGIGILTAISALLLRECKSPLASLITLSAGIAILLSTLPRLSPLIAWVETLSNTLPAVVGETVGQVLAAGILTSIGAETCSELGAPSLGARLELFGKIEILLLALPLLRELFSRVEALLS